MNKSCRWHAVGIDVETASGPQGRTIGIVGLRHQVLPTVVVKHHPGYHRPGTGAGECRVDRGRV
jgi:hypothetical protein